MAVQIVELRPAHATRCEEILRALPAWFGIEEAIQHYLRDIARLQTLGAVDGERVLGFLTLKRHFEKAAEIHVMAVQPGGRRRGLGRRLVVRAEDDLRRAGVAFLQVKTLSPSRPDSAYEQTRAFYHALGFVPLEEFPTLWGERNPCLQLIKRL